MQAAIQVQGLCMIYLAEAILDVTKIVSTARKNAYEFPGNFLNCHTALMSEMNWRLSEKYTIARH